MISSFVNQHKNTKYILQFLYSLRRLKPSFLHFFAFSFFFFSFFDSQEISCTYKESIAAI